MASTTRARATHAKGPRRWLRVARAGFSRRGWALVGITAALLVVAVGWRTHRAREHVLTLAAGADGGAYYKFAEVLRDVLDGLDPSERRVRIRIEVEETPGSVANLELLVNSEMGQGNRPVHLALMQNGTRVVDTALDAAADARAIVRLFPETYHVIVRADLPISDIRDLAKYRIPTLDPRSGHTAFYKELAKHVGLPEEHPHQVDIPLGGDLHGALTSDLVDAAFIMIATGNGNVRETISTERFRLLDVPRVSALQIYSPYVSPALIPAGAYGSDPVAPATDVATASLDAVLAVGRSVDARVVREIARVLDVHRDRFVFRQPHTIGIQPPGEGRSLSLALHDGARDHYKRDPGALLERFLGLGSLGVPIALTALAAAWNALGWPERKLVRDYCGEMVAAPTSGGEVTLGDAARTRETFGRIARDYQEGELSAESLALLVSIGDFALQGNISHPTDEDDPGPPGG